MPNTSKCPICDREFTSFAGMRQHLRRAHPEQYNQEMEEVASRDKQRGWVQSEIDRMALYEAKYEGTDVNKHLLTVIPGRTIDSIKGRRRRNDYRLLVSKIRNDLQTNVPGPVVSSEPTVHPGYNPRRILPSLAESIDTSPKDDVEPSIIVIEAASITPESNIIAGPSQAVMEPSSVTDPPETEKIQVKFMQREPIKNYLSANSEHWSLAEDIDLLSRVVDNKYEGISDALDEWLSKILNKYSKPVRGKGGRNNIGHLKGPNVKSQTRALAYKLCQNLYNKKKKILAEKILDNKPLSDSDIRPRLDDIEEEYTNIFEAESPNDDKPIKDYKTTSDLHQPITMENIKWAVEATKTLSKGPDGLSIREVKRIPIWRLVLFFNVSLAAGYFPKVAKKCRTILIPKTTDDLENVKNWRPITIGSILLRLINKVLASRFECVDLNPLQRGFIKTDGCLLNTATLHHLISQRRKEILPYSIIALDLRKAFDTVSHCTIERALKRFQITGLVAEFILDTYMNASTTIECGDKTTRALNINRGVKQGDPLSPVLFNMVMDELLTNLPPKYGIPISETASIPCLAYADDLVLLSSNTRDAQTLLKQCCNFFEERSLSLNIEKSAAISTSIVPKQKKLFTISKKVFHANGKLLPQKSFDFIKYLGFKFCSMGTEGPSVKEFKLQLDRIKVSPLKPSQKFDILTSFCIPRWIHAFQNPKITKKLLTEANRLLRLSTKQILHLPKTTPNAYLNAPKGAGGLGLFDFCSRIPIIMSRRLQRNRTNLPICAEQSIEHLLNKLKTINESKCINNYQLNVYWSNKLAGSYSTIGVNNTNNYHCNSWLNRPPKGWTGATYIKAIQLRGNMLPTVGIPSNPPQERLCRAGCQKVESLSHVLQGCYVTHETRISRHNHLAKKFASESKKKQWRCVEEPRLRLSTGELRKPDLVLIKNDKAVVCDIGVHWEGWGDLKKFWNNKREVYNNNGCIEAVKSKFNVNNVICLPLIVGARGGWCSENVKLFDEIGLGRSSWSQFTQSAIVGSICCHHFFSSRTFDRRRR